MECNKDEAVRAKEIAEKKMKFNDFEGARKIALKAKNLYPDLENLSQMLSICDVHCSSHKRLLGSEKDWYEILQLEMFADEATVKKQYRKLALILHPDKNLLCGAEGAFKLICEANAVLSDPTKKSQYDTKIKVSQLGKQKGEKNVSNGWSSKSQTRSSPSARKDVFWTCCPYCGIRYMYRRDCLNRSLRCQTCDKLFVGYEIGAQTVPSKHDPSAEKVVKNEGTFKFGVENNKGPSATQEGSASKVSGDFEAKETEKRNAKFSDRGKGGGTSNGDAANREKSREKSRKSSKKRERDRKLVADSNENCDIEDVTLKEQAKRQNVSHSEKIDVEDFANPVKSSQTSKLPDDKGQNGNLKSKDLKNCNQDSYLAETGEARSDKLDKDVFHCPDPEFSDFDKGRDESRFGVNQFWACYDTLDGMPRFYAKIKRARVSPFELSFTWLEANPTNEAYEEWVDEELPVGCGSFRLGKTEKTLSRLTFSHRVHCKKKGKKRGTLVIYPRAGDIWALFKDWDISWSTNPENHKDNFKYEIVEVLSNFVANEGIKVRYLDKVRGFLSLFQRNATNPFLIGPNEIYKFSHFVPCCKMSGVEREGVPLGSFELDPAALPMSRDDLYYPSKTKVESVNMDSKKKSEFVISNGMNTPKKVAGFEGVINGDVSKIRRSPSVSHVVKKNAK